MITQKAQAQKTHFEKHNKTAVPLSLTSLVLCQPRAELRSPFRRQLIQPGQEIVEDGGGTPLHAMIYALSVSSYYIDANAVWLAA